MAPPKTLLLVDDAVFFLFSPAAVAPSWVEAKERGTRSRTPEGAFEDNVASNALSWPSFSFLSASRSFLSYISFAFFFAFSAVDGSYVFSFALATMSTTPVPLPLFVAAKTRVWLTGNLTLAAGGGIACCRGCFRCCCSTDDAATFAFGAAAAAAAADGGEVNLWCLPALGARANEELGVDIFKERRVLLSTAAGEGATAAVVLGAGERNISAAFELSKFSRAF